MGRSARAQLAGVASTVVVLAGRQGQGMVLEGRRLIVADYAGVSVVELSEDVLHARVVGQLRDPSFRATASVVHVGDRYLVVNAGGSAPPPDTVASVPAVG